MLANAQLRMLKMISRMSVKFIGVNSKSFSRGMTWTCSRMQARDYICMR